MEPSWHTCMLGRLALHKDRNNQNQNRSLRRPFIEALKRIFCGRKIEKISVRKQGVILAPQHEELLKPPTSTGRIAIPNATLTASKHESPNGQNDEVHIERTVSSTLVKTKDIFYYYQAWYDVLFIVNCDEDFAKQLSSKEDVATIELSKYMSKRRSEIPEDVLILSTTNKCTHLQFEMICEESKISNVYVLQQFDEEHCILILSKGEKLEYADTTKTFKEKEIFETFNNPLHVFCGPSGMGKSILLQVLRDKHCPNDCKVIDIALREYNKPEPPNFKNLIEKLNQHGSPKTYLFLDGLDELKSEFTDDLLKFVKFVSSGGVNVWLSSRENLRELICEKLYAVPIEIVELNKKEQDNYIKRKLEKIYTNEEIEKIKDAVFTRAKLKDNENLLGNPLQLHILTEIFREDKDKQFLKDLKNNNLCKSTILTEIYKSFFEGKVKSVQEKDLRKDQARLLKPLDDILQDYEIPALQACFSKEDCEKLSLNFDAKEVKDFINKFKKDDDVIGIICKIDKNGEAMFSHQAYAEYFAARWFKRHPGKIPLLRDEIFSGKHQHLRMIFDVMLAERNDLHLGIIYKDIRQVEKHIQDFDRTDEGGRTALHLVCSYEQKYPLLDDPEKYAKQLENVKRTPPPYLDIMHKLLDKGRQILKQKDKLFKFHCVRYALQSQCWYAIDWMLKEKTITFKQLKRTIVRHYDYNMKCLAFYAVQFGCHTLLQNLIKHYARVRRELKKSEVKGLLTLENACKEKRFDLLKVLINSKAQCSRGNTILHFLVESCPEIYLEEILATIEKFQIDINKKNDDGATALHKAAESADVKIVEMLMEIGADFHILDNDGRSAWDYALSRSRRDIIESVLNRNQLSVDERNHDGTKHFPSKEGKDNSKNLANSMAVIKLFLDKGVYPNEINNKDDFKTADFLLDGAESQMDAKFENGKTVLHLACCEHRREDVIQLLERGADPNIVDDDNRNALHHYLLKFYAEDVIRAMIDHGIDLNTRYEKGDTLLHIVCTQGDTHTMTKLIEKKVDLNLTNDVNRNALHSLFQTLQHTEVRVRDRLINRHKYGIDIQHEHDSKTFHFGCEGCCHSLMKLAALREDEKYRDKLCTLLGDRDLTDMFLKYTPSGNFESKSVFLTARIIIFKMIHSLVEHGLVITKVDKLNKTALDHALNLKKRYPEIIKLLRKANLQYKQDSLEKEQQLNDEETREIAVEHVKESELPQQDFRDTRQDISTQNEENPKPPTSTEGRASYNAVSTTSEKDRIALFSLKDKDRDVPNFASEVRVRRNLQDQHMPNRHKETSKNFMRGFSATTDIQIQESRAQFYQPQYLVSVC